ncbi:MAG: 3,4-dehydroadipyl-CoA semialdehyde dehydrogenase, partial [Planctomycetota bacterium]
MSTVTTLLRSHLCGAWQGGEGETATLFDPSTEQALAEVSRGGQDLASAMRYAREVGGPTLRAMSFAERGALLGAMANAWHGHRDELLDLSTRSGGNTRGDAKFDIDGATGTLMHYAKLGEKMGDKKFLIDGDNIRLSRSPRLVGRHVHTPRAGVAVHINAYNFPAWGMAEKAACAILAGMPVLTKPATSTALLAERMQQILVEEDVLPDGVVQMLVGSAGDMLDHVCGQDVVAFTGSAWTGRTIRSGKAVIEHSVRVNVEADSLNAAVLGPDVKPQKETWDLMVREVTTDMTQKAGQKCTAIRRIFVPADKLEEFQADLKESIAGIRVGNPAAKGVRMGPVASASQLKDVQEGIEELMAEADIVHGEQGRGELLDVEEGKGY